MERVDNITDIIIRRLKLIGGKKPAIDFRVVIIVNSTVISVIKVSLERLLILSYCEVDKRVTVKEVIPGRGINFVCRAEAGDVHHHAVLDKNLLFVSVFIDSLINVNHLRFITINDNCNVTVVTSKQKEE